ncbi:MAG: hypothetical protein ABJE95_36425 [Byssovorax sp.]
MPPVKQYVNLPAGVSNLGPSRALRVSPNQVPNVAPGDRVDWWIEPDPGNNDRKYQSTAERTAMLHGAQAGTTVGAQHYFDNTINFTHVGGDKYVVKASRDGQRASFVVTEQFETWRKLFYTVWYSGADTLGAYNNIDPRFVSEFARHFIELERKGVYPSLRQATSARVDYKSLSAVAAGSTAFDWPFLNGGPNALLNLQAGGAPAAGGTLSDKPLHMAFLLVPDCYFSGLVPGSFPATRNVTGSVTTYDRVWNDPTLNNRFMYTAQASWGMAGATDVTPYFTTAAGTTWGSNVVTWNLATLPGLTTHLATAPANTYRLTFSFITRSAINGYSWGNFCVVGCTGRSETAVLGTLVHEMGHGIGQTVRDELLYNVGTGVAVGTTDPNPTWYTGKGGQGYGGQGPHCHTNAGLTPDPSTSSGQRYDWWPALGGQLCTIYHAGHNNRNDGVYCPVCAPRIRRVHLEAAGQIRRSWNHFG